MTLKELLKEGEGCLKEAGLEEYNTDAWLLLSFVTGVSRAYYYAHPEEDVNEHDREKYRRLINKRSRRIPLQHLTHEAFFMGHVFYVDENVLIPRQDTETVVLECLKALEGIKEPCILDLCTGSGCILTSILLERTDASGTGVDISAKALSVAERNAEALGTAERSEWILSDLFSSPGFNENTSHSTPKYDILVSNPPYIRTGILPSLMEEVRDHDPGIALDGGEDGLTFYRRITEGAPRCLKPGGILLYEIGFDQADEVKMLLEHAGFEDIRVVKDLSGQDRAVSGVLTR